MPATAFSRVLRDPLLPPLERLKKELRLWCELLERESPGSSWLYWHKCRQHELAAATLSSPGTKALVYATHLANVASHIAKLTAVADVVLLHDPRPFGRVLVFFACVPPDFAAFDREPFLESHPLPPLMRRVVSRGPFELLLGEQLTDVPGGQAAMCAAPGISEGGAAVPQDDLMRWMKDCGFTLTTELRPILWYPPYPDKHAEGAFLHQGIAYWRFFGVTPTWLHESGWASAPDAYATAKVPYVELSASDSPSVWGQVWDALREVRASFAVSMESLLEFVGQKGLAASSTGQLEFDLEGWSRSAFCIADDQLKALGKAGSALTLSSARLTVQLFRTCPQHSGWVSTSGDLDVEVEQYASSGHCPSEVSQPPFLSLVIE